MSSTYLGGEESVTDKPETQAGKFNKMAEGLECDESETTFEGALKKIIQAPKADISEKPE